MFFRIEDGKFVRFINSDNVAEFFILPKSDDVYLLSCKTMQGENYTIMRVEGKPVEEVNRMLYNLANGLNQINKMDYRNVNDKDNNYYTIRHLTD